tara:strand:+ start:909 stop:3485 length:2577 start_codon:yes stop_codon:yes gene_type:complete
MNKMNIVDYCVKNGISWQPILVEVSTDGKKSLEELWDKRADVKDFADEEWLRDTMPLLQKKFLKLKSVKRDKLWIAMDTRKLYQFDIDHLEGKVYSEEADELVKMFLSRCPYYKSGTKALGKHAFFKLDKQLSKQKQLFKLGANDKTFEELEILCGNQSWAKSTAVVHQSDMEIPTLKYDELPLRWGAPLIGVGGAKPTSHKIKMKFKSKKPVVIEEEDLDKTSKIFKYADMISVEHLDDYSTWLSILFALKSINEKSVAKFISSKSSKFKLDEFNSKWDSLTIGTITIGTLYYWAKISCPDKYGALLHKDIDQEMFVGSDDTQAKLFLREYEKNLVYKDGQVYIYLDKSRDNDGTKGHWHLDDKLEKTKKKSMDYLSGLQMDYLKSLKLRETELVELSAVEPLSADDEIEMGENSTKQKMTGKLIAQLKNCAKINSICERLRSLLSVLDFQEVQFDKNPYLFPFNNTCYDLKSHNWVGTRRDNYILETTGYNWREPTDEEMATIDKLVKDIFQDKSIRQEYLHFLSTGLYGIAIEKFIFASGGGGNGKGVINELMMDSVGRFGYLANNAVLLNPVKDGGNPAIANMSKKRFINYREPDEKKPINLSAVKELTGGKKISARKLFSNDDDTYLVGTHIMELNKKCALNGDLGDSVQRRLRDIPFTTCYSTDKVMLSAGLGVLPANPFYKSTEFQSRYKFALFAYLTKYAITWENETGVDVCQKLYESEEVSRRTKAYIEDNDEVFGILKSRCVLEITNKECFVPIKVFYLLFKSSEFYQTLSKHDQNKIYSEKSVREHLQTSTSTRPYFKASWEAPDKDGQLIIHKKVLRSWRLKTSEEIAKEEMELGISEDMLDSDSD